MSIRALELMLIDEELTFSAKSEEINENWYRPSNAFFRKRLENVLPEKSDLIEKLLQLSNIRNFIVHNSLQSIRPSVDDEFMPVIMHGDICASMFAQSECLGITKLYSPKMKFSDGQFITMEKINKATHDLKNIYQILVDITDQIRELGPNKKVRFTTMPIEKLANKKTIVTFGTYFIRSCTEIVQQPRFFSCQLGVSSCFALCCYMSHLILT